VKEALWDLLQPNRRKGVVAAAAGTLVTGALVLNAVFSGSTPPPAAPLAAADGLQLPVEARAQAPNQPDPPAPVVQSTQVSPGRGSRRRATSAGSTDRCLGPGGGVIRRLAKAVKGDSEAARNGAVCDTRPRFLGTQGRRYSSSMGGEGC
jgi:hypothetical protein